MPVAGGSQLELLDDLSAEHLEGTVEIADLDSQDEANQPVPRPGIEQAVARVGPLVAVANGDIASFQLGQEGGQIEETELSVGVGEHHQVATGCPQAGGHRGA